MKKTKILLGIMLALVMMFGVTPVNSIVYAETYKKGVTVSMNHLKVGDIINKGANLKDTNNDDYEILIGEEWIDGDWTADNNYIVTDVEHDICEIELAVYDFTAILIDNTILESNTDDFEPAKLPGFKKISKDVAKAWTPVEENCILIYAVNEDGTYRACFFDQGQYKVILNYAKDELSNKNVIDKGTIYYSANIPEGKAQSSNGSVVVVIICVVGVLVVAGAVLFILDKKGIVKIFNKK